MRAVTDLPLQLAMWLSVAAVQQVVTELLQELNESVAGSYIEESPENLISSNPQFFRQFSIIVATQVGGPSGPEHACPRPNFAFHVEGHACMYLFACVRS